MITESSTEISTSVSSLSIFDMFYLVMSRSVAALLRLDILISSITIKRSRARRYVFNYSTIGALVIVLTHHSRPRIIMNKFEHIIQTFRMLDSI